MKTLLVLRHAKSDWNADFARDHERPLNQRGLGAARYMGGLIAELGLVPDLVISSTAVRARTTAELAIESGQWDTNLALESGLYDSGVATVVRIVAGTGKGDRVMVVGHQPTWGSLVHQMTGVPAEIKTATLAVIKLPIDAWSELPGTTGELVELYHPAR